MNPNEIDKLKEIDKANQDKETSWVLDYMIVPLSLTAMILIAGMAIVNLGAIVEFVNGIMPNPEKGSPEMNAFFNFLLFVPFVAIPGLVVVIGWVMLFAMLLVYFMDVLNGEESHES